MATDYVTTPTTEKGKVFFGLGCGIITVVIRLFAGSPEGVSYAILLMNILTPHIDRLCTTRPFGATK
jgi:electron transport complex protein RnfD